MRYLTVALAAAYVALCVFANVVTAHYGLVAATPTLWGVQLLVPAGTWAVGAILVVRNQLQELTGRTVLYGLIIVGAVLSYVSGAGGIAVASGVTFLLSETLDTLVYSRVRRTGLRRAVTSGTLAGAVVDTLVFLSLAYLLAGLSWSWLAVGGQLVVKGVYMLLVGLVVVSCHGQAGHDPA